MTHGFYAVMGGYVFDLDQDTPVASNFSDGGCCLGHRPHRLSITLQGIALLAKCGHLPQITKEEIVDKSKADDLTKGFVCLQAG